MSDVVTVEMMDSTKKNSPIAKPVDGASTILMTPTARKCFWNGREFANGDHVIYNGVEYVCEFGQWDKKD